MAETTQPGVLSPGVRLWHNRQFNIFGLGRAMYSP